MTEPTTMSDQPAEDTPATEASDRPTEAQPTAEKTADGKAADATVTEDKPETDPFGKFAPETVRPPGRLRRTAVGLGRALIHEWTLAALASLVIAAAMTWPALEYPLYTIPKDIWDPTLQAWQMAWAGHAVTTNPLAVWDSNTFYPEPYSYAFSDTLLGYFPAGLLGTGPGAALLRYNIVFVLAFALAFFGAYALARQLGARIPGAAVAGAAFAYAPWRWEQAGHLHVLSSGGIALCLAMLARGHGYSLRHGYRPEFRRPGWALAGWLVAAWQIGLGFGIGLPFAYVLAGVAVVGVIAYVSARLFFWSEPKPFGWKLLGADALGGLIFAAVGALMAIPYFKVLELHPYAERSIEEVNWYSPPIIGFFTAPDTDVMWGDAHAVARQTMFGQWGSGEKTLLIGFAVYGLAAAGLVYSTWRWWQRVLLAVGVVVSAGLAMGTQFLDGKVYEVLYDHLPGWSAIRTPGRLVIWTTLFVGLLAAGAISAFGDRARDLTRERVPARPHVVLTLAMFLPMVLVLAEGLQRMDFPTVPQRPAAMAQLSGPAMILPSNQLNDENVMLWSTDGFVRMVNGGSGFTPRSQDELRKLMENFPDQASVDALKAIGVREVLVLKHPSYGDVPQNALTADGQQFGLTREDLGDGIIFHLTP
ncbi:MAG: hypothetical protein HOV76_13830 [Hamadaea sp.]|nr:hypothetical protein [Hamadaea sp.]